MSPRDRHLPEHVLFHPDLRSSAITLGEGESVHALRSLRMRQGDSVVLTDGSGTWGWGEVTAVGKKRVEIAVTETQHQDPWPSQEIWLGMGVLKSQRMDVVVEKASELGVRRLFPLILKRSVAKPQEGGAKEDRWRRIALESLKQCRRSHLMEVEPPATLREFLPQIPQGSHLWVGDPAGMPSQDAPNPSAAAPLVLVVGPEGGLAPQETEMLLDAGGVGICLGSNRLRAETAGMTLLVCALDRCRAFSRGYGNPPQS